MKASELLDSNPLLSDRTRLAIMALLAASKDPMDFKSVLGALEISKGNLSSHIRKLEEAGYVEVKKEFVERKPLTSYICTEQGRKAVTKHLKHLEKVLSFAVGK